jgi:uncharacterized membrane protein (UPF0127 family)
VVAVDWRALAAIDGLDCDAQPGWERAMGRGHFGWALGWGLHWGNRTALIAGIALVVVVTVVLSRSSGSQPAVAQGSALQVSAPQVSAAQGGVALVAGWNNVAYVGETVEVDTALGTVATLVESVWHWEAATASWTSYFPGVPVASDLRSLQRGESYWVRVREAVVWTQPAGVLFESAQVALTRPTGAALTINVELADTGARRSRGLMFRTSLAADDGMLFVWPSPTSGGFWMQNTFVPLSIAFIDQDGLIIDIQDMEPETTTLHRPPSPYRWALEVNQGWFGAQGIAVGDGVELTGT